MAKLFCLAISYLVTGAAGLSELGLGYHVGDAAKIDGDFRAIRQHFGGVRTFLTHVNSQVNTIDVAAAAGLKIATGIPVDKSRFQLDLDAVVAGAKRHPNAVQAVYVGNEDLLHGYNPGRLIDLIRRVKRRLVDAGLPSIAVGTVQTDGSLLEHPQVATVCDVVGVNIHPFFSTGQPMANFDARWRAMKARFPASKLRITETGWPTAGGRSPSGQEANEATSKEFFRAFYKWHQAEQTELPYWFMFQDVPSKGGFETYFGLAREDGSWKIDWQAIAPPSAPEPPKPLQATLAIEASDGCRLATANGKVKCVREEEPALFTWDLATNGLRTSDNKCLAASSTAKDVRIEPCDDNNADQKWLVHRRASCLIHLGDGMCMAISPPEGRPELAVCDGGHGSQTIRVVSLRHRCSLEQNVDYPGNDIMSVAVPDPASCCKVCRGTPKCKAFSWMQGTCWLKDAKGPKLDKVGVVSVAMS